MATKQYEYFGNQSPLLNNRMKQAQLGNQRAALVKANESNFVNDPWFTLGSAIGQSWADNYNERGISKGMGEMQDALKGYLGQFGNNQQAQQTQQQGPLAEMLSKNGGDMTYAANKQQTEDAGMGSPYIQTAPVDPTQPSSYAEARKAYKDEQWLSQYRNPNTPNPTGDAIATKQDNQAINQMGNNIDFENINKADARQYVRKYLEDKGRTPYQIEQVLAQFDNTYDAKEQMWGKAKATDWMTQGAEAAKNGNYALAQQLYAKAGKYRPDEAKVGLSEMLYQRNRADKIADEKRAIQNQRDQYIWQLDEQKRRGIGAYKPTVGRGGSSTATNPMSNPFLGMYETTADGRLVAKKFKLGGSQYTDAQYANALKILNSEGASQEQKDGANAIVNDYLNSGPTKEFTMTNPVEQLNALKYIDSMQLTPKGKMQYAIDHGVNVGPMFGQFVTRLGWNDPGNDIVYDDNPNHY